MLPLWTCNGLITGICKEPIHIFSFLSFAFSWEMSVDRTSLYPSQRSLGTWVSPDAEGLCPPQPQRASATASAPAAPQAVVASEPSLQPRGPEASLASWFAPQRSGGCWRPNPKSTRLCDYLLHREAETSHSPCSGLRAPHGGPRWPQGPVQKPTHVWGRHVAL